MGPQELPPGLRQESEGGSSLPTIQTPESIVDFTAIYEAVSGFFSDPSSFGFFTGFLTGLQVFLSFFSLFFMLMIIYIVIQRNRVVGHDASQYKAHVSKEADEKQDDSTEDKGIKEKKKETRYDQVIEHLNSDNPAEWRIAIIEADNILYEILDRGGYQGETLGEMLTNATYANFGTLESAWEAHKMRNRIAHEGSSLDLTKREARRIIGLYENIFKEFEYL